MKYVHCRFADCAWILFDSQGFPWGWHGNRDCLPILHFIKSWSIFLGFQQKQKLNHSLNTSGLLHPLGRKSPPWGSLLEEEWLPSWQNLHIQVCWLPSIQWQLHRLSAVSFLDFWISFGLCKHFKLSVFKTFFAGNWQFWSKLKFLNSRGVLRYHYLCYHTSV